MPPRPGHASGGDTESLALNSTLSYERSKPSAEIDFARQITAVIIRKIPNFES